MHEFSTMQMILNSVLEAAEARGADKILEIRLKIGSLTFLNPEQLGFAFSVLSKDTLAEDAKLKISIVKPKIKCLDCGYIGRGKYEGPEIHVLGVPVSIKCEKCGSRNIKFIHGRECEIKSISILIKDEKEPHV